MPPDEDANEAALQVARDSITSFTVWIANADTKAGLVAAALAVVVSGVAGQDEAVAAALGRGSGRATAALVVLVVLGVLIVTAFAAVGKVLLPQTTASAWSRFGWPSAKDASVEQLAAGSTEQILIEACSHARELARITHGKFTAYRWALKFSGGVVAAFLLWVGLSAGIT